MPAYMEPSEAMVGTLRAGRDIREGDLLDLWFGVARVIALRPYLGTHLALLGEGTQLADIVFQKRPPQTRSGKAGVTLAAGERYLVLTEQQAAERLRGERVP